ncbi:hypothetical protein BHYA_0107g00030 [Botrytis hyacinthi]|uniref:Uncharacterized protein n=1 Tax=Botrytis hyacinthi TaxID=278943 RepID=A0A4Z1GL86_9HELO|nr:hypothetical protein BHYA_0107g00030 [Botrytis hyacinthi]
MAAIISTITPMIGDILAQRNRRCALDQSPAESVGFMILLLYLRVKYSKLPEWKTALKEVDFLGNAIVIPSIICEPLALVMGGTRHPRKAWRIIGALILGFLKRFIFHLYESSSRWCTQPTMPPRLYHPRISTTSFLLIFLRSIIITAANDFLAVYFRAGKKTSPLDSSIYHLSFALPIIPISGLGAACISKTGLYTPLHDIRFARCGIEAELPSTLTATSHRGSRIGYQILTSSSAGLIFTSTLVCTLAPLREKDVAIATGFDDRFPCV